MDIFDKMTTVFETTGSGRNIVFDVVFSDDLIDSYFGEVHIGEEDDAEIE